MKGCMFNVYYKRVTQLKSYPNNEHFLFQAFAVFCMLYAFFWIITRRLEFICRRFGTLCLFHLHRQVDVSRMNQDKKWYGKTFSRTISYPSSFYSHLLAYEDGTDSVPKRRHIKSRRQVITQKKAYKNEHFTSKSKQLIIFKNEYGET